VETSGGDIGNFYKTGCTISLMAEVQPEHCLRALITNNKNNNNNNLESSEMWCWRRIEKTIWTNHVRNEEMLHGVKKERNILHTVKRSKANWIGHILCNNSFYNTLLKEREKEEYQ
jgi:hypothetical protein